MEKKQLQKEMEKLKLEQEENRKKLGISEEEEERILDYVDQNKDKGIEVNVLFARMYRQILEERKIKILEEKRKEKAKQKQEERERIKSKALELISKREKKKKLSDNKTEFLKIRISEKEKLLIDALRRKGNDVSKELRKALYKIDRELSKEVLAEDYQYSKKSLKEIRKSIKEEEKVLASLRNKEIKTETILIEIEKRKYKLADLKKDHVRAEKYFNELKELIK